MPTGSLTVVGTGIDIGGQLTPQARAAFEYADEALYLVADPVAGALLEEINPRARSLHALYESGRPRLEAYEAMVDEMLLPTAGGRRVCAAFYGHPGIFVYPGQEAIRRSPRGGLRDSHAAGDLVHRLPLVRPRDRPCDSRLPDLPRDRLRRSSGAAGHGGDAVLLQINVIGQPAHPEQPDWSRLPVLIEYLTSSIPSTTR